jgi:hypothetical protein
MSSFTVQIQSSNKLSTSTGGTFYFNLNWASIPFLEQDATYEVNFSFVSDDLGTYDANVMKKIYILSLPDLGNRNCFNAGNTSTTLPSTEVGIIRPYSIGTTYALTASVQDNPSIIFKGVPRSNQFIVELWNIGKTVKYDITATWLLLLHFKKI